MRKLMTLNVEVDLDKYRREYGEPEATQADADEYVGELIVAGAAKWLRSFDYASLDQAVTITDAPVHTVRGKTAPPEGWPYGTIHDGDCPACQGVPWSASPRSEAYWSS